MKRAVVAKRAEEQFQRLAPDQAPLGHVVDYQMGEVGLAGHRAKRRELRACEADQVAYFGMGIGHGLQAPASGEAGSSVGRPSWVSDDAVILAMGLSRQTAGHPVPRPPVPMFAGRVASGPSRDMHPSRIAPDRPAPSLMHGDGPDG
jgi:hypothetical protein